MLYAWHLLACLTYSVCYQVLTENVKVYWWRLCYLGGGGTSKIGVPGCQRLVADGPR
jgi:hypothetical protein